jgi:hypothetical protein
VENLNRVKFLPGSNFFLGVNFALNWDGYLALLLFEKNCKMRNSKSLFWKNEKNSKKCLGNFIWLSIFSFGFNLPTKTEEKIVRKWKT